MTTTLKPYLALDLETTGLNTHCSHILQIAAVWDDGVSPVDKLQHMSAYIKNETIAYAELGALAINADLFKKVAKGEVESMSLDAALYRLCGFVIANAGNNKVVAAGANVGKFDLQLLETWADKGLMDRFHHRTFEVGSLYATEFGRPASLTEINKITGRGEVKHDALSDAFDIVHAIRHKFGVTR
jgi:oligoribonuclease (3'-5' exoribonuclease)